MKKTMKNTIGILSLVLAMIFVSVFTGCNKTEESEVGKLFEDGYYVSMMSADEETLSVILQKENSYETLYMIKGDMTAAKYEEYAKVLDSEDSDAALVDYLSGRDDLTVENITDKIPSGETLNSYVGKTFGELEQEGYYSSGWIGDEGNYVFTYDGPMYCLNVTPADGTMPGSIDDYSDNAIRELTIGSVEFAGFSLSFFDGTAE